MSSTNGMMSTDRSALVLAGGWMHPPGEPVAAIESLVASRGMTTDVVTDADGVAEALDARPDLLVVASCWFSLSDPRYTDEQRAEWAVVRDPVRENALADALDGGLPVLALHTSVICFDGWDGWGNRLGGRWDWDTSGHPPPGSVEVRPEPGAPVTIPPFTVIDEEYQGLVIDPGSDIVARSAAGNPLMWVHADGRNRSAVSLLGHDHRSLGDPAHIAARNALVDWLL